MVGSSDGARVAYITSASLREAADNLPSNVGRSSLVHNLIQAYNLVAGSESDNIRHADSLDEDGTCGVPRARLVEPRLAVRKDLTRFHDSSFIDALMQPDDPCDGNGRPAKRRKTEGNHSAGEWSPQEPLTTDDFGLSDDCPRFPKLSAYVLGLAGAALTAGRVLRDGEADIALLWDGGRHHCTKSRAAGYCYVNDIVLAVLEMQKPRPARQKRIGRVLILDFDLHHGDGTAEAFASNKNVVTLSMHAWYRGFFPSTPEGHTNYTGSYAESPAAGTSLNIGVQKPALSSANFLRLVRSCMKPTFYAFRPEAVIVQCGVDGLAGDPCREWNVGLQGYGQAIQEVFSWVTPGLPSISDKSASSRRVPVLLVGGGGYNHANAARAWAYLTSISLGRPLPLDGMIPEDCPDWDIYAPEFTLDVPESHRKDENVEEDLTMLEEAFKRYASDLADK